jgi:hypothetical protein
MQDPRYRQRGPGQGHGVRGRRRRRQEPGGGYSYRRQHGGQWPGFEPERRDYGPGYRSQYTYAEGEPAEYEAGYLYEEEHEQWPGFEPERRDYGPMHGPGYSFEPGPFEGSDRRQRRGKGRGWRQRYGREYPFPEDRPEDRPSVYRQEHPYTYTAERPPYDGYPPYQAGPEPGFEAGPHAGKGPKGYRRSDESMFEETCEALSEHGYLDASQIEVSVEDGEVTLEGSVDSRWSKRLAEDLAAAVRGVWDVHNRLRIPREEA